MKENNPLIPVSMEIILYAGNARNDIEEALHFSELGQFDEAAEKIRDAEKNITTAHTAQTGIIQNEMQGTDYEPCLLFTHAQDTLMTINSEVKIANHLIKMYQKIYNK